MRIQPLRAPVWLLALLAIIASPSLASRVRADEPAPATGKVLRHIVMVAFKADTTPEQLKAVAEAFAELPKKIDLIKGFEGGTNVSKENRAQGFTHCFMLTFNSAADCEAYVKDPAHQEFVKLAMPHVEKLLVFDFWGK
ncbi:MAG: Dabb family protein [Planctomycetia bacterium]|nr:Dabb family protein [Planctomycetia bacterium]